MKIYLSATFKRLAKKLHAKHKAELEKAIAEIAKNPERGILKKGDLAGVRVYKFSMSKQLTLIAYAKYEENAGSALMLITFGSHENFYDDLKSLLY